MKAEDVPAHTRNPIAAMLTHETFIDHLAAYVIREHRGGRALDEIVHDRFVTRARVDERLHLLDHPDVVRILNAQALSAARRDLQTEAARLADPTTL